MKTLSKTFVLIFVLNAMMWITPQKAAAQVSVNFQIFYDNLSPYGDWVINANYGYVWVPEVSYGFTPYSSDGHWVFTNAGWTWVSNYSWGWAPFHYGRWMYDNYYGWTWVPGDEWGPGWVSWRVSEGYYGWAPIGPGISISFAYSSGYSVPSSQWTFVRDRDFGRTNINNYYVNSSNKTTIIRNSTVINNIQVDKSSHVKYNSGPNRTEVQKRTGRSFAPVALRERKDPGQKLGKGELQIYKPRVEKNHSAGQKPAPSKVAKKEDVKPVSQRGKNTQSQKGNQQNNNKQVEQQQKNNQAKQHQEQQHQKNNQQNNNKPVEQHQQQHQNNNKQAEQQQNNQQAKQQHNSQQAKQQQDQQERNNQQAKQQQQQEQQQKNNQQAKQQQQQEQQQHNNQQQVPQQQQEQQQHNNQPAQQHQDKKNASK